MVIRNFTTPKTVIATDVGCRVPYHGTIDLTKLKPNSSGAYRVPAGLGWHKGPAGADTLLRPAQNATLMASVAAAATILPITDGFATAFLGGEVLTSSEDYGKVTVSGTFSGVEVITVTVGGKAYPVDISGLASYTLDAVANLIARALEAKKALHAFAFGSTVHIFADKGSALTLTVAVAGGTGVATASAAALASVTLGTVASSSVDDSTLTLAAGLAAALPAGLNFGVATEEEVSGFTVTEFDPEVNRANVGLWTSGTLSKGDFFFSRAYAQAFPEIYLV